MRKLNSVVLSSSKAASTSRDAIDCSDRMSRILDPYTSKPRRWERSWVTLSPFDPH